MEQRREGAEVHGEKRWIVTVMDLTSRCILAWDISDTKEKYNVAPLLQAVKGRRARFLGHTLQTVRTNTILPLRGRSIR